MWANGENDAHSPDEQRPGVYFFRPEANFPKTRIQHVADLGRELLVRGQRGIPSVVNPLRSGRWSDGNMLTTFAPAPILKPPLHLRGLSSPPLTC